MVERCPDAKQLLAQLSRLANGPANQSTALPPGLYHDAEIFALERQKLFAKGWLCPGLAAEIAKPGDYLTFSIDDQPIFTIRGRTAPSAASPTSAFTG